MYKRQVIPFQAKIKGKADIKNYADYLVEHAGGAILSWIIEGARKAIDKDFKIPIPKCVADACLLYTSNIIYAVPSIRVIHKVEHLLLAKAEISIVIAL